MGRLFHAVATIAVFLVVVFGVMVGMAMAGVAPVAAGSHHFGLIEWYLNLASDRAVERGGAGVTAPPDATSAEMLRLGLVHYQEMCVACHGAPGIEPSDIGKGLYPDPPLLARRRNPQLGGVYWIIKNGVRDTGMPAFGATHDERELWALAAFAVAMTKLSPQEYAQRAQQAGVPVAVAPVARSGAVPSVHANAGTANGPG